MTVHVDQTAKSHEDMLIELMLLREENAKLKAGKNGNGSIKVFALGEKSKEGVPYKGTLGVKVGRHYSVLFASQWLKVLDMADEIRKTIEDNKAKLSWKED